MRHHFAALWLLTLLLPALPTRSDPSPAPASVGVDTLLRCETDLSQLPNLRDWASNLQSSYDRSGGNGDFQSFPAMTGTTATLADLAGPGAVVRLWSANRMGRLKSTLTTPLRPSLMCRLRSCSTAPCPPSRRR